MYKAIQKFFKDKKDKNLSLDTTKTPSRISPHSFKSDPASPNIQI